MKEVEKRDIPAVRELLRRVFGEGSEFLDLQRLGGLTNHTYHVFLNGGRECVVRIPGEGTEDLIVRKDEKISTQLACELGIDAKLLYFGDDGSKVTEYISDAVTMSSETMKEPEHIIQAAEIFKKLHRCGKNTGVPFEVFDMAAGYEKIIDSFHVFMYDDYQEIKKQVMDIKRKIDESCDTARVPCHNDPLCENWITGNGRMYLIDWEYAGMNDSIWDLADVSIEAGYDKTRDEILLNAYFDRKPDNGIWRHFYANKIYVDYLWTLWAKARVPFDGQSMEDWAVERYARLKENIAVFKDI